MIDATGAACSNLDAAAMAVGSLTTSSVRVIITGIPGISVLAKSAGTPPWPLDRTLPPRAGGVDRRERDQGNNKNEQS